MREIGKISTEEVDANTGTGGMSGCPARSALMGLGGQKGWVARRGIGAIIVTSQCRGEGELQSTPPAHAFAELTE